MDYREARVDQCLGGKDNTQAGHLHRLRDVTRVAVENGPRHCHDPDAAVVDALLNIAGADAGDRVLLPQARGGDLAGLLQLLQQLAQRLQCHQMVGADGATHGVKHEDLGGRLAISNLHLREANDEERPMATGARWNIQARHDNGAGRSQWQRLQPARDACGVPLAKLLVRLRGGKVPRLHAQLMSKDTASMFKPTNNKHTASNATNLTRTAYRALPVRVFLQNVGEIIAHAVVSDVLVQLQPLQLGCGSGDKRGV